MTNSNSHVRLAHDILDGLSTGHVLSRENEKLLRGFLPERPKQKTLEEITIHVLDAWSRTSDNYWGGYGCTPNISIEDWLGELHVQLQGLEDAPIAPALPAGMRLAEHPKYGRCVVSPKGDPNGVCDVLYIDSSSSVGSKSNWAHECELTFIDAEPAPAHPVFLETEADYENAPVGTIVATAGAHPWVKLDDGAWVIAGIDERVSSFGMNTCSRRVLRWGDA